MLLVLYEEEGWDEARLLGMLQGDGIIKVLDIRQYYVSETQAVQAFMKVQASVPPGAMLKSVQWFGPTGGSGSLGD